jgi:CO/xanthine dehydrogenase Mo-binding subunit
MRKEYSIIGKRNRRFGDIDKVTGKTIYVHDIYLPNMLYGKIFRSTVPHARIKKLDVSAARELGGVMAVITGKDIPKIYYGPWVRDQLVFADEIVRYIGEPIAAVAAKTEDIAEEALRLIEIEYEELPAVFNVEEAFNAGAVLIHTCFNDYWRLYPEDLAGHGCNVNSHTSFYHGDIEKGFKESDIIVEEKFTSQIHHQCYLERRVTVADYNDKSGDLVVWASAQSPFLTVALLARVMETPIAKIRVITPPLGGAFGGKANPLFEPHAAFLSKVTGRPVRIELTREEDFATTNPRHASISWVKIGAKKDGTFTAFQIKWLLDSGAYTFEGPAVCDCGSVFARGPYWFPNWKIDGYNVYTNKIVAGAFRGFGNPQVTWARESSIDLLARKLGMSKFELVKKNMVKPGQFIVTGQTVETPAIEECVAETTKVLDIRKRLEVKNQGRNFACFQHPTGILTSSAIINMHEDGSAFLLTGISEIGGGQATALASIAAEVLGIPLEKVKVIQSDTAVTPYEWSTVASRSIRNGGAAVKLAAEDAKMQMLKIATRFFGEDVKPQDLETGNNFVYLKKDPNKKFTIDEICFDALYYKGGAIVGRGTYYRDEPPRDPNIMKGVATPLWADFTEGIHAVELEVDPETGIVRLLKLASSANCGQAINPMTIEGQMDGGLTQGVGFTLMEDYIFDNGKMVNPSFLDYTIPTAMDAIDPVSVMVEKPSPDGPFGAKGIAETGMVATSPAISNAIEDALGIRIKDLPITPYKIIKALREKDLKKGE